MAGKGIDRSALSDDQRCTAQTRTGARCANPSMTGIQKCKSHARGRAPGKSREIKAGRAVTAVMQRYAIDPVPESEYTNGAAQLSVELRRTMAWIAFCEAQIQRLESESDFIFGVAGSSRTESEDTGTEGGDDLHKVTTSATVNYAATVNGWIERLEWNRAHLMKLSRIWIAAGFEQKRLELEQAQVQKLRLVLERVVARLGASLTDDEARAVVGEALMSVAG